MSKIQVSTALERQIPEFIREDYATFVKFVKAYYEFLEQTQNRNLEDIRSIDKTLNEFVSKFKKELAAIFPTGNIPSERIFLERISDFYNSRGSVESYQLLFRVLFNKEVEIFHPSTQILKLSDGKWIQEKSVFVKLVEGNIYDLKGKIIQISTSKKVIDVFSPNVVLYRDDIYEVFLDKQYYNDIAVGDTVEYNGSKGIILPCPAKYKVVKEGKGFEVGSIYNLPTADGDGSVIKITRVGSQGEIKALQIISFGLDYKTNFYAQLSNKTTQALAFYHPITEFIAGTPREYPNLEPTSSYGPNPASQDQVSDYIGFGYFIGQNYFYYDPTYVAVEYNPLTSPEQSDMLQTVWFADTTYVGDIIASFYTNEAGVVIDEDSAEIKITLGPVAVYPGYYATNDGFVSDECYIQDGDYYQLFSYVVKVEEQLENYKDIVKTLLEPTGLKLFGEYNIYKNFDVFATPLLAYIRRQLFDQIYQFGDYAYKDMVSSRNETISQLIETRIKDIFKPFEETTPIIINDAGIAKYMIKAPIGDNFEIIDNDISKKDVTKLLIETVSELVEEVSKSLDRINSDFLSMIEGLVRKDVSKIIDEEIISEFADYHNKNIGLNKEESIILAEDQLRDIVFGTITDRIQNITDVFSRLSYADFFEVASIDQINGLTWDFSSVDGGSFYNTMTTEDTFYIFGEAKRDIIDIATVQETTYKDTTRSYSDSLSSFIESVVVGILYERTFEDTINNFIEGSTLYFNPFSEALLTPSTADDFFAEEYVVNSTSSIT